MTIIFQRGDLFWIESLDVVRATILAGNEIVSDITLTKAGHVLGVSVSEDYNTTPAIGVFLKCTVRKTDNNFIAIGDSITQIRTERSNGDGTDRTMGMHVILFMRGRGT